MPTLNRMLLISESDVERLLDIPLAIDVVEEAFRQFAAGKAVNVPRERAKAPGVVLHSMSAVASYLNRAAWKCYTTTSKGAVFHVGLSDASTGELLALIEADRLGQIRTGAATAVAVRHLTNVSADSIGLFGTGWQAQTQLAAVAAVRQLRQVTVFSRDANRRRAFAEKMSKQLSVQVVPAEQPSDVLKNAQVVVTATTSRVPVFEGRDLRDEALVCAVGSNWLEKAEIDTDVFRRAKLVVCDSRVACEKEAGDVAQAVMAGVFRWESAVDLGQVVQQQVPVSEDGVKVFKSVGLALEDLAVAELIVQRMKDN